MNPLALLGLARRFAPYLIGAAILLGLVLVARLALHRADVKGYARGKAEVTAEWDRAKAAQADKTLALIAAARKEEREQQSKVHQTEKTANVETEALRKRISDFERDNQRLRVNRDALCKRQPSLPTAASPTGTSVATDSVGTVGNGSGEIDLTDVARAIGRLGAERDAAVIRANESIGYLAACQALLQKGAATQ